MLLLVVPAVAELGAADVEFIGSRRDRNYLQMWQRITSLEMMYEASSMVNPALT